MLVFRSHESVPDAVTSPTLRGLAQEWVAINATAEYHRQVGVGEPVPGGGYLSVSGGRLESSKQGT